MRFIVGLLVGLFALIGPAELLVRFHPPADVANFIEPNPTQSGPFAADVDLGAAYRSIEELHSLYAGRLEALDKASAGRPIWAMFGNSFVQAPGMLGDTAQARLLGIQIFYLQRNEPFYLRVAQFRLLVQNGLKPERVIFTVLPIDFIGLAQNSSRAVNVSPGGQIWKAANAPSLLAPLVDRSRLALTAWVRSGHASLPPGYNGSDLLKPVPHEVLDELDRMLSEIARIGHDFGIPVTILFIPIYDQVLGNPSTAPQQAISETARKLGLDFLDTTSALLEQPDKPGLFIPDRHLSERGNALVLDRLLAHLGPAG